MKTTKNLDGLNPKNLVELECKDCENSFILYKTQLDKRLDDTFINCPYCGGDRYIKIKDKVLDKKNREQHR